MPEEITRSAIRAWIETIATGEFHYRNILGLAGKLSPEDDTKLRKIIYEFCHEKEPICESVGRNDGYYIPIDNHAQALDWQSVGSKIDSGLILPFDLRKYVFIYPDTTIVFAGSKSSGKTGVLYRTVVLNMHRIKVVLLTNLEGGLAMLKDRFDAMDIEIPVPAPFEVKFVTDHFHQYIKDPKTLYVLDYIDAPEGTDFYMIGAQIKKIDQKLQGLGSNAVIGVQKPVGRDTAFGGEQTLKAATLYIAMDSNKLKIVDAKVPADKKIHPKNMAWTFLYQDEGTKFVNIQPYIGE
ncbi:hypothetical protein LCGC14_2573910 [marine sediment metagenome]|uniref:Uncharacterized protein n=1 Tax=marine sediment metagenome TaxID=412755 RepID=A0A0F9AGF3_9ZZZZ